MINILFVDGVWEVWTDTEDAECDGRCLASDKDKGRAIALAGKSLQDDLEQLAQAVLCSERGGRVMAKGKWQMAEAAEAQGIKPGDRGIMEGYDAK